MDVASPKNCAGVGRGFKMVANIRGTYLGTLVPLVSPICLISAYLNLPFLLPLNMLLSLHYSRNHHFPQTIYPISVLFPTSTSSPKFSKKSSPSSSPAILIPFLLYPPTNLHIANTTLPRPLSFVSTMIFFSPPTNKKSLP